MQPPRRRWSTVVVWAIALILVGSLLASLTPGGHGSDESRRPIDPARAAKADQLDGRVTAWGWNIAAKGLKSVVPAFNQRYPKVDVDVQMTGANITTRFLLSISAGTGAPDVMQLQCAEAPRYIATRRMTDLTPVAAKYEKDFPPASWANCVLDGRVYAIPWDIGPCGVFYKRDLFEKHAIDPARIETWDDYIAAGEEILRKSNGRTKMLPLAPADMHTHFEMLLQQARGQYFDGQGRVAINSSASRRALELMKRMRDARICAEVPAWGHEWMAGFNADTIATYPLAVWLGGTIKDTTGQYGNSKAKWGVFNLPAMERGGPRVSNVGGSVLVIPDQCPNKEAAWAFVEYALCTREGQVAQYANFDLFPAYLPALEDPFFQQPDEFYGGQKVRALFAGAVEGIPILYRTPDWAEGNRYLRQQFSLWAGGKLGTDEMLDGVAVKMHRRLGREMAP